MNIKRNQIDRPKHLADVIDITDDGVGDAPLKWQMPSGTKGKVLRPECRKAGQSRQDEERDLFYDKFPGPRCSCQWPVIEQQKNSWCCDQHRFRHQTAGQRDRQGNVATDRSLPDPSRVCDQMSKPMLVTT